MDQLEVKILDRVFKLQVPTEERSRLMEAVRLVDGKMREIRDAGKASGLERIAVNAALQLAYEFLGREARPAQAAPTNGSAVAATPASPSATSHRIDRISEELDAEIRRQEALF